MTSELSRAADECPLMAHARRMADWVGAGRPVTPKGVPRPADVPGAAVALGVTAPVKVRSAADVEAVHRPWLAAREVGWLRVTANRAVSVAADADGDPLALWWAAVRAVLRAESHDDRRHGAPVLCRILLTALSAEPSSDPLDPSIVHELLHCADLGDAQAVHSAFRQSVMPVDAGLEFLGEVGAVDGGRVTALGRWMLARLLEEWPSPVPPDASATELLDRLATLPGDEVWPQAGPWLTRRQPGKAAEELLAAAAEAAAAQRLVAVDMVAGLGEAALPAWLAAAEAPMLGPHARLVLAGFAKLEDEDDEDDEEEPEPGSADRSWLAVEYALAALTADGPDEAYHVLREHGGLDADGSGHPGKLVLKDALSELIAAGGPPVPTYQLKVTLTGVRPPVWRRVRLPATATLGELHRVIQIAFDWDDDHLHMFTVDGRRYADPFVDLGECADESRARVGRLAPRTGATMTYVYDLGDCWDHRITVERIFDTEQPQMSAVCVAGQGDAPEEDWFPDCGRHATPFDLAAINRRLSGDRHAQSRDATAVSQPDGAS